jgi:hypothetical protein
MFRRGAVGHVDSNQAIEWITESGFRWFAMLCGGLFLGAIGIWGLIGWIGRDLTLTASTATLLSDGLYAPFAVAYVLVLSIAVPMPVAIGFSLDGLHVRTFGLPRTFSWSGVGLSGRYLMIETRFGPLIYTLSPTQVGRAKQFVRQTFGFGHLSQNLA